MSKFQRHFWGWHSPVLENAVSLLTRDHHSEVALDLSETLIIVPTSEAGRRLREALAQVVAAGVLIPWVWTAEQALLPPLLRKSAASPLQAQMAWQRAVQTISVERLTALFPVMPEERGWTWQLEMARLLAELKSLLGAGGLNFEDVVGLSLQDGARWADLAVIEKAYLQELKQAGLSDAQVLKLRGADQPLLPEGVTRVVVLAAPDLPPLFQRWVRGCSVLVSIAVQAPKTLADQFDDIGRPLPAYWGEDASQTVPLDESNLHLHHDASTQSEHVITLLRDLAPKGRVAVGLGDPEVGAVLEEKLALEHVQVFEPGGVAATEVGLWHVLTQMRTLLSGGSWRAFATLLRVPEMRVALIGSSQGGLLLLQKADALAMEHMPVTLDHAVELMADAKEEDPLLVALHAARAWIQEFKRQPLLKTARSFLIRLYGDRKFKPESPKDQLTTALADAWLSCCAEIEQEAARFGLKPKADEAFSLSLEALSKTALSETRGEVDLVLQGWLELLWEPAPNLIVAGVNEEHVPGILIAHPFLPDRVRRDLGLPCQATRFARDSYTLRALAELRSVKGALHVLCGQWSERGDALRPSRLLFLCADHALPQRVKHLFPKEESASQGSQEPVRTLAWLLRPSVNVPNLERISPSRIRSYLECPFRDYLSSQLHMEATDASKRELAANEFGNLAHHALQKLAEHPQMKLCVDEAEIADYLIEMALAQAHLLYGKRPAPLISLQLESLKQRLRHAAEIEAAQRREGWMIHAAEWKPSDATPLLIDGASLRCQVDRIERHASSGHLRVLDFKTSDKLNEPLAAHVRKMSARTQILEQDEWKCFDHSNGTRYQWKDLQLPLYAAVLSLHGLRPDEVGYFTLPKSVQDTKVVLWPEFSDEWVDHALHCSEEVVRRLRAGQFWPPSAKAYARSFDPLFLGDITAAVEMPLPSA